MSKRRPPSPHPPAPGGGSKGASSRNPTGNFQGYTRQDPSEFRDHANEIKALATGTDFVERKDADPEKRPPAFDRQELQVVRSWVKRRPLEPNSPAAAMVPYPRMWTTKRGRYAKFRVSGTGAYGLIRCRPTF
jgi:hypothetical protein